MRFFLYRSTMKLVIASSRMAPKNGFRCMRSRRRLIAMFLPEPASSRSM
jgi:hypothetical protein